MAKYISNRQQNIKIGIVSYTEDKTVLEVTGKVGIGTTNATSKLHVIGDARVTGVVTASSFRGDGSQLTGVTGTQIVTQDSISTPVFLTFANNIGVTSLGVATTGSNVLSVIPSLGNLGIGTTNPQQKLWVEGNGYFTGILTANRIFSSQYGEFVGGSISGTSVVGTSLSISGISTLGVTSTTNLTSQQLNVSGITTLGVTSTTNLTSQQLNVSGITTLGVTSATNLTSQQLNVSGITTLGVTSTTNLTSQQLNVSGISTFTNGPVLIGGGTSTGTAGQVLQVTGINSSVYIGGNLGIGTTNATSKLHVIGDVRVSGAITATTFVGALTGIATFATNAGIATYATSAGIATYATNAGIATFATNAGIATYATNAGIATFATNAGIATYATNAGIATYATYATNAGIATFATNAGIATYATNAGIATFATNAGIATYATSAGIATYATYATNAGIATFATNAGIATFATNAGIATYATSAGIATYATNAGIATFATNAGIATYATNAGIATYATYATNAGIATFATNAGIATFATNAGIATYATNAGIATYATSAGIATFATNSGIATNLKGGVIGNIPYQSAADTTVLLTNGGSGTVLQSNGVGNAPTWTIPAPAGAITGLTIRDEGNIVGGANSISALNFVGSIVSVASTAGIATITFLDYVSNSGIATFATNAGIATFATNAGIATFATNAGIATFATNATNAGIATFATNAGIATYATNAGIATYATNAGIATFATNAGIATALQNARTFEITGDVVASPISFDGTGNVSFAATIQPNSVGLGTDTTGDYVRSISGTSNQITVSVISGEGSTPTLSIPNQFTVPQDLTVTRDVQITRNLNVDGNITIGGTTAFIDVQRLQVSDADLILGFRTDAFGNDASNDTTANHGGIAIASTEGSPLVNLTISGIETVPATYKKIMWFKAGAFAGLGTDAWLSNYAIGIGSTQFPTGTRLAAGNVQFTQNDLAVVRNINSSGIITATTFVGALTGTASTTTNIPNLTGAITSNNTTTSLGSFTSAQLATALTDETGSGSAVFATSPTLVTPSLGIATATSIVVGSGVTINSSGINAAGIITASSFAGNASSATFATSAGIATFTSEWTLGANGSSDYTFTGPGFTGAENDPVLYLVRGQQYKFTNTMNAHPFRIQSTVNGSAGTEYNDGITNNNVSNGTLTWNVQFNAPGILYYQCTAHGSMGGKIYIIDAGIGTDVSINTTGIITATSFVGTLTGTATSTTNIPNLTGAITSNNTTTSLGSFTSTQLATALTDETGSGSAVFATSPTLVTPSLGIATATSIVVGSGSTFTNGPILVGTATSTGTASQPLQVTGSAYVSGNLGIGTTNPQQKLWVEGNGYFTGILTANRIFSSQYGEFVGGSISGTSVVGTSLSISGISTLGTVKISSGIITATSGVVTYYGDGRYLDLTNNSRLGIGSTFTSGAVNGNLFYHIDYGKIFVYYDEVALGIGTDAFWVDAAPFNVGIITSLTNVSFSSGSAISPSMFFVGNNQTGFFSPGSGQFTVVSSGSSILNINPSGVVVTGVTTSTKVRVGTASTFTEDLVVNGSARVVGILTIGSSSITLNGTSNIINVGTGITINGNTGIVSATSFFGDGSGLTGAGSTVFNNTTTNQEFFPLFTATTSGTITASGISTSKLTYNPSTGTVTATAFVGNGSGLTGAGSTVVDDTTTNQTFYPVFTATTSGTITASKVSTSKLTYNPSTGAMTAVDFNSTSDINLKENIHTVGNALEITEQLRGVSFDWKETGRSSYGVIAQELEEVLPELVKNGEVKSVNYNGIIGVLIEAIKELKKEVEDLKETKYR